MMTPQQELILGAEREALMDNDPEGAVTAYETIRHAAIEAGFCPMCGYPLINRSCYNPKFCAIEGRGVYWTPNGDALILPTPLAPDKP